MRDYTGKTIYLGIDVHKNSYSVTALCEGEIVKRDKLQASPEKLVAYCRRFFQNALIRIANKTYGVCTITGKLIPKKRLLSVPHATLCIDAKIERKFTQVGL